MCGAMGRAQIYIQSGVRSHSVLGERCVDFNSVHVPDSGIIDIHVDGNFGGAAQTWARSLSQRISVRMTVFSRTFDLLNVAQSGDFSSDAGGWISCSSTTQPAKRSIEDDVKAALGLSDVDSRAEDAITPLRCPLVWAAESNAFDCVSCSMRILSPGYEAHLHIMMAELGVRLSQLQRPLHYQLLRRRCSHCPLFFPSLSLRYTEK